MDLIKEARSMESKPDGEPVERIGRYQNGNRIYVLYRKYLVRDPISDGWKGSFGI